MRENADWYRLHRLIPPDGATAVRVTVPVSLFEPMIELVLSDSELSVIPAGCRVMVCDTLTPGRHERHCSF
jgi:hypothetical protein